MGEAKRIFRQAVLMTAVSFAMRAAGVSFSVFISNRIGAESMGLYSLIGGVYGFCLTVAASGIFLGTTRMVAEALGRNDTGCVAGVMKRCFGYALCFGLAASLFLTLGADLVGGVWIGDARTVPSLRCLGMTLPLISLTTCMSGYFTAVRRVGRSTVAQVVENAVRIGTTLAILTVYGEGSAETACLALVIGGCCGDTVSFLLHLGLYLFDRRKHYPKGACSGEKTVSRLLSITLPVAVSAYMRAGLITLEHLLIPRGLAQYGADRATALAEYGLVHSMVLPVILFPAAVISSFSGLVIPEMSSALVRKERRHKRYMIDRSLTFAMLFAVGVAGIIACFSEELGIALYPDTDAGALIRLFALLIPVMYVDTAVDAVLKGLGEQLYSMRVNIADAAISVLLVWLLVPRMGINGYILAIFVSETFNTSLSLSRMIRVTGYLPSPVRLCLRPVFCVLGSTSACRLLFTLLPRFLTGIPELILHLTVATVLYLVFLVMTGSVSTEEQTWVKTVLSLRGDKNTAIEDSQRGC